MTFSGKFSAFLGATRPIRAVRGHSSSPALPVYLRRHYKVPAWRPAAAPSDAGGRAREGRPSRPRDPDRRRPKAAAGAARTAEARGVPAPALDGDRGSSRINSAYRLGARTREISADERGRVGSIPSGKRHVNVTSVRRRAGGIQRPVQQTPRPGLQLVFGQKPPVLPSPEAGENEEKPEKRSKKGRKSPK